MSTPLEEYPQLAQVLGLRQLLIKREDKNPSGSHKDRALWPMLAHYLKEGKSEFVLSSSGNAAISAVYYLADTTQLDFSDWKLDIFISPYINQDKNKRLEEAVSSNENIIIHKSLRPKSEAIKLAKEKNYQLIRPSTDDLALLGYQQLAQEIHQQLEPYGQTMSKHDNYSWHIFVPTSSGTAVQGLYEGFKKLLINNYQFSLHLVQTSKVNIIAREFDQNFKPASNSLASAIVDTIGYRRDRVIKAVKESGGSGWVISDEELKRAEGFLAENTNLQGASWDSLLSLAGLIKAVDKNQPVKNVILLFTGK